MPLGASRGEKTPCAGGRRHTGPALLRLVEGLLRARRRVLLRACRLRAAETTSRDASTTPSPGLDHQPPSPAIHSRQPPFSTAPIVLSHAGLEELIRLEPRFRPYRESLFSRAGLALNPDHQTAEVLAQLDESIAGFCGLLVNHFLAAPAFKALEYLIRRFK